MVAFTPWPIHRNKILKISTPFGVVFYKILLAPIQFIGLIDIAIKFNHLIFIVMKTSLINCLFIINGYFKDNKDNFSYIVCTENDCPNVVDDESIFMFGISEDEMKEIIQQGEDSNHYDFIITSYEPLIIGE
jgi:hypothetical protein